jgi:cephalosporin-C deacetylase
MPLTDLPIDQLRKLRYGGSVPQDLKPWWQTVLDASRSAAIEPVFERYREDVYRGVRAYDVTLSGHGGDAVKAWLVLPTTDEPAPCVVRFIGYGGGRGIPAEHLFLPSQGVATLVMDTRGQGGLIGSTPDAAAGLSGSEEPGWMTRGLLLPESYFYTRVYVDAVRAIETAREHPAIDADRIATAGRSQGGGIAIAAAALTDVALRACWAAVPFLADFPRSIRLASEGPYLELASYLARRPQDIAAVHETVSHVDAAVLAPFVRAPTTVSVCLMDACCPPSSGFALYNALTCSKELRIYEFSPHTMPIQAIEHEASFLMPLLGA